MATLNVVQAVRQALDESMARDERVILLGEDVGLEGWRLQGHRGLAGKAMARSGSSTRPLAEAAIVGVAIGAAWTVSGRSPRSSSPTSSGRRWTRSSARPPGCATEPTATCGCPLVIRTPYGGGVHGALYHSQSIEATFAHVPGLKVVAPATPADAKGLLAAAIARSGSGSLPRAQAKLYRSIKGDVPDDD